MTQSLNKKTLFGVALGLIAAIIWGLFPVLTRYSMDQQLSTYDIAALRFMVAGPLLIIVLWKLKLKGVPWNCAIMLICGAGAPYLVLVITGLEYAPAAHFGAITPSSMLIFSVLGSWIWLGNKLKMNQILGTVIIVCGILFVSWESLGVHSQQAWIGDLLFLLGGFLWATYTLALKKWNVNPLHAISIVSVFSMILYLPYYFTFENAGIFSAPLNEVIFQAVFQGILSVLVALLFYSKAVEIMGAEKGAIFGALVPAIALLTAIPILNEHPTALQIAGIGLITLGMLIGLGILFVKKLR